MRIGIIGAGMIGATAARLFSRAGHEVAVSNSRGPDSLRALVSELAHGTQAMTVDDAARFGDVVLLAVPWRASDALPSPDVVRGKIVIDAMNPYAKGGALADLGDSSSSEETAKRLPGARIVKAFNTIHYQHLASQGNANLPDNERRAIFVAGDDAEAKAIVSGLVREIGFAPVDTGPLREGGLRQQPSTPVYNRVLTGAEAARVLSASPQATGG